MNNWFCLPAEREPSTSPVVDALNTTTNIVLAGVAHPTTPSSWKAYPGLMSPHQTPISLVLIVGSIIVMVAGTRHLWLLLRSRAEHTERSLIIALTALITGWTFVIGIVGELGEQERFRNMIDPLVIAVAAAVVIEWWRNRGPSQLHRRLRPSVTVPIAIVFLTLGLVVVNVGQGPPAQSVITSAGALALPLDPQVATQGGDTETTTTVRPTDNGMPSGLAYLALRGPAVFASSTPIAPATTITTPAARAPCHDIVHLGDSNLGLSLGLFRNLYANAGVAAHLDFANGRGAIAARDGGRTALDAISSFKQSIPADRRCWVIALSDTDAMQTALDGIDPTITIGLIADAIGNEPTVWVTPVLASATTAWSLAASTAYNQALLRVAAQHANITVVDWQDIALQHLDLFLSDGIHYQAPMYVLLAHTVMTHIAETWNLQP